ncbi:autotransporter outer membrane beta-barrel domain-containing protein [Lelliottia aquatilis]|uniref:autotransporter outer membrane beta-barrel domain-containing protein n=1 Tax=Lelliottia aquatilis TaxID=2080838 RepID=UPI0015756287|nr:autotransporter outer membrane beta-barrel domain-containing protein [Lelliottia aquatilis]
MNPVFRKICSTCRVGLFGTGKAVSSKLNAILLCPAHGSRQFKQTLKSAGFGLIVALAGTDTSAVDIELLENDIRTILGGYKDKAAGSADSATQVSENIIFKGGTLDVTGGYYRAIGKMTVTEGQYGRITGGSGTGLPSYFPTIPALNTPPTKSGAMFLLYDPREPGGQLVLEKDATLEIDFNYDGRNYVAVTNNGNYGYVYTPVVFGDNSHIKLTAGTFRFDPYRHDIDVKLSKFIFNGGWLSTRGGDDIITADEEGQSVGKIEMGMGSDVFIIPEGLNITALRVNGQPASEVRMYEFADTQDKGTGGLTGSMAEGTGQNPSDKVEIRANASSTDINYLFGYYNDVMTMAAGASLIGGTVNMGNGPDTFSAGASTLNGVSLKLADGDDVLNLAGTTLQNGVAIDLGNGNDVANLTDLTLDLAATPTVIMGAGNDTANLTNVQVKGNTGVDSLSFGAGNDTLNMTRVNVEQARIGMNGGANTVNILADDSGGTTRIEDRLNFTSTDNLSTLRIQDSATLHLNGAELGFTGQLQVNTGGTLSGSGTVQSTGGTTLNGTLEVGNGLSDGLFNLYDAVHIDANDGAIITGGGELSSSGITLSGTAQSNVEANRILVYNSEFRGGGALNKAGAGTFELGSQNSYSGGTRVDEGLLVLKEKDAAGTGAVTIGTGATTRLNFSGAAGTFSAEFDNALKGKGDVVINGHDIDVTADNQAFSGLLTVLSASSIRIREALNLGASALQLDGSLHVEPNASSFVFKNRLAGSGELSVYMYAPDDQFSFDADTGTNFRGTLAMGQGAFTLAGENTQTLTNATLRMDDKSTTTVGTGVQHIEGLAFNGGTAVFDATIPDSTKAASSIAVNHLDASGTGTVNVNRPSPYIPSVPGTPDTATLLEQDDGNIGVQLVSANNIVGSGGALALQDQQGLVISAEQQVDIDQNAQLVARGKYDFGLTTAPGDGLYVNYGLKEVDLLDTRTLTLSQTPAATGAAADLAAKVTGSGHLAISAGDDTISLSNATNDYSGETTVNNGTLLTRADNALGNTQALNLTPHTRVELASTTQTIGQLHSSTDSVLALQNGKLSIQDGGEVHGQLTGGGELRLNGGQLTVSGASPGMSASTRISVGAAASLMKVRGLGSGEITDNGTLEFIGANGQFANTLSGDGEVRLNNAADIDVSGNNRQFSGQFEINDGNQLGIARAENLGTSRVVDEGTLLINTATHWTLDNTIEGIGDLVKDGKGVITVGGGVHHTGITDINAGGMIVGEGHTLGGSGAGEVTVDSGALLAGLGTVNGQVKNAGTVSLLNGVAGLENTENGTFTLANGLTNAGVTHVAGPAGKAPGNILQVKGDYNGQDGQLVLRTVMGGDNSATDKLVIDGGVASGHTRVVIKSAGGDGDKTDEGIRVVETRNEGSTDLKAFSLDSASDGYRHTRGSLAAGAYDYHLVRGGAGGVKDDWYLINNGGKSPIDIPGKIEIPPNGPDEGDNPITDPPALPGIPSDNGGTPTGSSPYRPEVGAYMSNRLSALIMPVHTLHERQGQAPRMTGKNLEESSDAAMWLRLSGARSKRSGSGGMNIDADDYLLHLGSDILRFSDGDDGSMRLGLMGMWGNSSATASNGDLSARGDVDGYNVGLYATWYGHQDILSGPYADIWLLQGMYKNQVKGDGLASESYRSKTLTGSLESGYSFMVRDSGMTQLYLEPQAQLIMQHYTAPDHTESTGTTVSSLTDSGVTTRLGVRLHANINDENQDPKLRPYSEVNWWHGRSSQSTRFNADVVHDNLPADRLELKVGLQGNISKQTSIWGSIAGEKGSSDYRAGEIQIGVKYSW